MSWGRSGVVAAAAVAFFLAGCDRNTAEPTAEVKGPEAAAPAPVAQAEPAPPAAQPQAPEPIPPSTQLPVNSVESVMLSQPDETAGILVIHVLGTAASAGWSLPMLEPITETGGNASVVSYQFVATSPEANDDTDTAAEVIETELRIAALPPAVKTIRIVSATNEISAPVAQ
jgi:hypothetical protein